MTKFRRKPNMSFYSAKDFHGNSDKSSSQAKNEFLL